MKQLAQIDLRGDELIVSSFSRTSAGFWVGNGTYFRLAADSADDELGLTVEQALSATRDGVPVPAQTDPLPITPIFEELGLKSYSSYIRGVRSVEVGRADSEVDVVPTRNDGARGGFVEIPDRAERLLNPSSYELGAAIRHALARAA